MDILTYAFLCVTRKIYEAEKKVPEARLSFVNTNKGSAAQSVCLTHTHKKKIFKRFDLVQICPRLDTNKLFSVKKAQHNDCLFKVFHTHFWYRLVQ